MESSAKLQQELDEAIETWRNTWKNGSIEELLLLYSEDVRVMRGGVGLIQGREQLKATMQHLSVLGMVDIDFYSDEIGGLGGGDIQAEGALAYQRYHEAIVTSDGSELYMIHGFMLWKRVSGRWLIEMYANCAVTVDATNTSKLRTSIQKSLNQFGRAWATHDANKVTQYFTEDCILTVGAPPVVLKGTSAITDWLAQMFGEGSGVVNVMIDRIIPVSESYVFSQLVYANCPSVSILDEDGKLMKVGCGNAIVKKVGEIWQICEALWNIS